MGDNPNVKSGDSPDGDLTRVRKPGTVVSKTTTTEFIPAKDGNHPGSSKDQQMLSVEKTVTVRNEEVLMVNGTPMSLEGAEGEEIKACLIQGRLPNQDLINHLLLKAGLLVKPLCRVQAELTVKNTTQHTQTAALIKEGKTIDVDKTSSKMVTNASDSRDLIQPALTSEEIKKVASTVSGNMAQSRHDLKILDISNHLLGPNLNGVQPCSILVQEEDQQYDLLLWSRMFQTPSQTLSEFSHKFEDSLKLLSDDHEVALIGRAVQVMSRWLTWFPEDFQDEAMMQKARKLFSLIMERQKSSSLKLNQLLQTMTSHLAAMKKHEMMLERIARESKMPDLPVPILPTCLNPSLTAHELTRIELDHLCFLGAPELVAIFAKEAQNSKRSSRSDSSVTTISSDSGVKSDMMSNGHGGSSLSAREEAQMRTAQRCKNYDCYVEWFNRLSFLVASTVCRVKKKKPRSRVIEFWIEVARECVNIGNFNSMMGIISGLNMFPVARLKKTWMKIQSGKFAVLEHHMDPTSNFKSYRSTFDAAISRSESATDDRQRIIIPFFTLFVKDLYIAKESLDFSVTSSEGPRAFDLEKASRLSSRIREFCKWKDVNCPYQKREEIASFLLKYKIMDEAELDYESYICEAPTMQHEKNSYKQIKHKIKQSRAGNLM